jgi:unsaturated rhamnogalacturonyl hydrolase
MMDDRCERVFTVLLSMQRQSWEQGVAAQAAAALGREELALLLAEGAVTLQAADGRLGVLDNERGAVNGAACGEAVLAAARATGAERWSAAAQRQLAWLLEDAPRAADGTLFHLVGSREVWADTVYMVVPFLVAAGHHDAALRQVEGHRQRLHDPVTGLYAARWDEDAGAVSHPEHWGAASGWVISGIARALRVAPSWPADVRDGLAGHVREVLDACLGHRRADGLFGNVIDDPATFRETNVAQMLAFTALVGAADGWLPAAYAATGQDLFRVAAGQVDERGFVTGACGSPWFDRPGVSPEAQAFHVLAAVAASAAGAPVRCKAVPGG